MENKECEAQREWGACGVMVDPEGELGNSQDGNETLAPKGQVRNMYATQSSSVVTLGFIYRC